MVYMAVSHSDTVLQVFLSGPASLWTRGSALSSSGHQAGWPMTSHLSACRSFSNKGTQHKVICRASTSFQFSSVTQSCPTLCNPMNRSTPGLPVRHQLPESTQTHVHWVGDAIQPSHPLLSPSPPALNLSQHLPALNTCNSLHLIF